MSSQKESPEAAYPKGARVVGAARMEIAKRLVKAYTGGASLRQLVVTTGRSYGFVHRVLTESGVNLRSRGGSRVRKPAGS